MTNTGCAGSLTWEDVGDYVENQGLDAAATAQELNTSFLHCRPMDSIQRFLECWLNLTANGTSPSSTGDGVLVRIGGVWSGALVDYHDALPDTGQRNKALKRRFKQILQNFDLGDYRGNPCERNSEAGFITQEWTEVVQELCDDAGTGDFPFGMTPDEVKAYFDDGDTPGSGDDWSGTGGYAYIGVTAADVQAAIDQEVLDRNTSKLIQDDATARNTYVNAPVANGDRAAANQGWADGSAWMATQTDPTYPANWGQV